MDSLVTRARALQETIARDAAEYPPASRKKLAASVSALAGLVAEIADRLEALEGSVTTTVVKTRVVL